MPGRHGHATQLGNRHGHTCHTAALTRVVPAACARGRWCAVIVPDTTYGPRISKGAPAAAVYQSHHKAGALTREGRASGARRWWRLVRAQPRCAERSRGRRGRRRGCTHLQSSPRAARTGELRPRARYTVIHLPWHYMHGGAIDLAGTRSCLRLATPLQPAPRPVTREGSAGCSAAALLLQHAVDLVLRRVGYEAI